jgi:hypothetical protein
MMNNNDLQEAIIDRLKHNVALLAALTDADEIREAQWQGTEFVYPCVRVALGTQVPSIAGCELYSISFSISAFSELESSKEANEIAYLVSEALETPFTFGTVKFLMLDGKLIDAIRQDRTWVAKVNYATLVYYA